MQYFYKALTKVFYNTCVLRRFCKHLQTRLIKCAFRDLFYDAFKMHFIKVSLCEVSKRSAKWQKGARRPGQSNDHHVSRMLPVTTKIANNSHNSLALVVQSNDHHHVNRMLKLPVTTKIAKKSRNGMAFGVRFQSRRCMMEMITMIAVNTTKQKTSKCVLALISYSFYLRSFNHFLSFFAVSTFVIWLGQLKRRSIQCGLLPRNWKMGSYDKSEEFPVGWTRACNVCDRVNGLSCIAVNITFSAHFIHLYNSLTNDSLSSFILF